MVKLDKLVNIFQAEEFFFIFLITNVLIRLLRHITFITDFISDLVQQSLTGFKYLGVGAFGLAQNTKSSESNTVKYSRYQT